MEHDLARLRALFDEVMQAPPESRAALLASRCGADTAMRRRVEALIATAEADEPFLSEPTRTKPPIDPASTFPPTPLSERPGTRIGPYKLLQNIGEGGFGVVFMAEQDQPVRRRVALKIIKLGMDTRQVVARFEQERQALALMDHPNIARVFDAGATDSGRPYFVMEYVIGDPITAFADAHKLSVRQRLDLHAQVCGAVQHAHTKGVIHRDIKPRNVLVSMVDGKPFAKVIDFGIAKATGARLTDKTLFTEHHQTIGTPEYMSPEQAEGSPDIDTRTDVYALGVLLYELLTGTTPFDAKRLRSAAYAEMRRIIKEEEPPAPSVRMWRASASPLDKGGQRGVGGDTPASNSSVQQIDRLRDTEPFALRKLIRGELDWIVMKALDKDRARRYETPNQLAADVQRHLLGEPVVAAPPSAAYRLRKFVRKHKSGVLAVSAVTAALMLGITGTTWGLLGARRANSDLRAVAKEGMEGLKEVMGFDATPGTKYVHQSGGDNNPERITAVLEHAGVDGTEFTIHTYDADGKEVGGSGLMKILTDYAIDSLYELRKKTALLEAANTQLGEEVKRTRLTEATMLLERAGNLFDRDFSFLRGDTVGAIVAAREALAIRRSLLGNFHPDVEEAVAAQALYSDEKAESLALWREALDIRRQRIGGDDAKTVEYLEHLTLTTWELGEKSSAIQSLRELVAVASSLPEPKYPGPGRLPLHDELLEAAKGADWSNQFFEAYDALPYCPRSGAINRLIAVARLRLSQFQEALVAASWPEGMAGQGPPPNLEGGVSDRQHPVNLAVTAMAQWQLDRREEARGMLRQLRELMNNSNSAETWVKDTDAKALLAEAEALIEPKADPPASP